MHDLSKTFKGAFFTFIEGLILELSFSTFKMLRKTWHEFCVHNNELVTLYIAYYSTTDIKMLVDCNKCLIEAL